MTWDRFRRPSGTCATPHARERTGQFHRQRKARGAQVKTGDFGTGYSSFARLPRFSVAARKLRPSAVQAIATHSQDVAMAGAVGNRGRNLKQRSVAERVETSAQLVCLRLQGFREGRGHYFSRPVGGRARREPLQGSHPWVGWLLQDERGRAQQVPGSPFAEWELGQIRNKRPVRRL